MNVHRENGKVSVIVPIYNGEKYLRQCLNSLGDQTYGNIEIICVNDGSTDDTLNILSEYAQNDNRFIVVNQKNTGAGGARNAGLKIATGEFIIFIDSDDYVEKKMLEESLCVLEETGADLLLFGVNTIDDKNEINKAEWLLDVKGLGGKNLVYTKDIYNKLFFITACNPWNKIFRASYLDELNILFGNTKRANDVFFVGLSLAASSKIAVLNKQMINYRMHSNSLQGTDTGDNDDYYIALKELKNGLEERNLYDSVKGSFLRMALRQCVDKVWLCKSQYAIDRFETIKASLEFDSIDLDELKEQDYILYSKYKVCNQIKEIQTLSFVKKMYDESFSVIGMYQECISELREDTADYEKTIAKKHWRYRNLDQIKNKRIILYGAGDVGRDYYTQFADSSVDVVSWIDKNWSNLKNDISCIESIEAGITKDFDYIVIAIRNKEVVSQIKKRLISEYDVEESKVLTIEEDC